VPNGSIALGFSEIAVTYLINCIIILSGFGFGRSLRGPVSHLPALTGGIGIRRGVFHPAGNGLGRLSQEKSNTLPQKFFV
jgi:hypothetical protein